MAGERSRHRPNEKSRARALLFDVNSIDNCTIAFRQEPDCNDVKPRAIRYGSKRTVLVHLDDQRPAGAGSHCFPRLEPIAI